MLTLLEEIEMRIAEILAQEPMTEAQYNELKNRPNATLYDSIYEDDDERWGD